MKGFTSLGVHELSCALEPIDWQTDFETDFLAEQKVEPFYPPDHPEYGSWPSCNWGDPILCTTWALLTLQKAAPPPVCPEDPDPATQGYWHRQCLGVPEPEGGIDPGREGRGPQSPTEPGFVEELMPCADNRLEDLGFYALLTCDGMDADPPSDACEKAIKQLTALVLNVCSPRLADGCEIDVEALGCSSTSVGELLDEAASLIQMGQCHQAKDCVVAVNEGYALVTDDSAGAPGCSEKSRKSSSPDLKRNLQRRSGR
jgi:hypothetical protein